MVNQKSCLLLLFIFPLVNSYAQSISPPPHGNLLNFTPPSPSAASLGKFGDIPVSYCTGIPNITIPIYSYQNERTGLSLNISLNYHGGGVRIEEKASNVGMNWALDAGGLINRTIRGLPDEDMWGFWNRAVLTDATEYFNNQSTYNLSCGPQNPFYRYAKGLEDSEPDVFSFNFGNKSGRFVIGKNNQVLVYPDQRLNITRIISQNNLSFVITDEAGIKYTFDQQENVYLKLGGTESLAQPFGISWYLSKITAPFNTGEINFSYESFVSIYTYKLPQVYYKSLGGSMGNKEASSISSLYDQNTRPYDGKRLTRISFPDGVIANFIYNPGARCDVPGDKALQKIEITDGRNMHGFRLGQNYNYASFTEGETTSCGSDNQNYRLWLHTVTEYSEQTEKPPYVIEYDRDYSINGLPNSMSYQQDHWGFYNGAVNNSSLLPYNGLTNSGIAPSGTPDNAIRRTYPQFAKEGSIKKLHYPTGGYSEFEFESNEAPSTGPTYDYQYTFASISGLDPAQSTTFTLTKPAFQTTTEFRFEFGGLSSINNTCVIKAQITSLDGATIYSTMYLGPPPTGYIKTQVVTIPAGQYKYKYNFESGQCTPEMFALGLRWINIIENPAGTNQPVGGLRIKKISENDGVNGDPIKTREYKYLQDDGNTSSGSILIKPVYSYNYDEGCFVPMSAPPDCQNECLGIPMQYNVINSTSLLTLPNPLGSPVLYSRVEEKLSGNGSLNNGRIVRTFTTSTTTPDNGLPFDAFNPGTAFAPYMTPQYPEWIYGLPLSEIVYDQGGNLKHSTINNYSLVANSLDNTVKNYFKSLKVSVLHTTYMVICSQFFEDYMNYGMVQYYPYSGITKLSSTTETDYGNNGVLLTKVTNYQYHPNYLNPSKIVSQDSKGNTIEQRLYYPYDYTIGGVLQEMVNANIISPLVSKETWQQPAGASSPTRLLNAGITEFAKFNNIIIKPYRLHYLNADQPVDISVIGNFNPNQLIRNSNYFKQEVQLNSYDASGNVLEQFKINDIYHSYIWGYTNTYPIAEVLNAKDNEIYFSDFEKNGWDGAAPITGTLDAYDNTKAHSGRYSGRIDNVGPGEKTVHADTWLNISITQPTKFKYSGWIYSTGPSAEIFLFMKTATEQNYFTYVSSVVAYETNKWVYVEGEYTVPANITKLNIRIDNNSAGTVWFDDIRLHPSNAQMTTYTYDPLIGMTSQTDANNRVIYYEHDAFGRLSLARDEDKNIIKKFCYNFKGQQENCSVNTTPLWQSTGNYRCVVDGSGNNTGYQEREERDNNPNSATYNQLRWVGNGYNTSACPLPCDYYSCSSQGEGYACINGQCEWGYRVNTGSYYDYSSGRYECIYHYEYSDGSWSQDYSEWSDFPCPY